MKTPRTNLSRRSLFTAAAAGFATLLKAVPLSDIQLAVTTDEIDEDATKAAEFLNRFGVRFAELRSVWGKYGTAQPADRIREVRGIFDAHKIQTSIVDTAFFRGVIPADDAALDKE